LSKKKKVILIIAILSCIGLAFIGGQSFAKYVSEVRGDGMAEVATWDFKVNGQSQVNQTIDLGSTCNNATLVDHKIAPGTSGSFNINIDAEHSDVGITYLVQVKDETEKPRNLKFYYNSQEYDSVSEILNGLTGTFEANTANKSITVKVEWVWPYEVGDDALLVNYNDRMDTSDAQNIANYRFDVFVTGTQVRPQA